MRTQRYLSGIQNGAVAKRQTRSKNPARSKELRTYGATRSSSRLDSNRARNHLSIRTGRMGKGGQAGHGRGSRVIWMMLLTSAALSAGFVFALRSQINAYKLGQAEERLKMKLDEYASQQKFLALDQQRAINTGESDRAGRRNGLDQLKLDHAAPARNALVQRVVSTTREVPAPVKTPLAGLADRPNGNGQKSLRSTSRPDKSSPQAKAAKVIKVEKSVKSSVAANKAQSLVAKAKKQSNYQRQALRSQQKR